MWFTALCAIGIGLFTAAAVAALAYERGRFEMRREIIKTWEQHRCGECGATPRAHLIHVSGCAAGWPRPEGPESFPLPGGEWPG